MIFLGWKQRCQALEAENRQLRQRTAWLEQRLAQLQTQNTQLIQSLAAAKKHSGNSSKCPSSDIVKAPSARRQSKRRLGAQPGHPKHTHPAFPPGQPRPPHRPG
jgi:cell division septum initiation protein DivIVA